MTAIAQDWSWVEVTMELTPQNADFFSRSLEQLRRSTTCALLAPSMLSQVGASHHHQERQLHSPPPGGACHPD